MARITVEDCLKNVKNRFELVLIAAKQARRLMRGSVDPTVPWENDKATVVALREIAAGHTNFHDEPHAQAANEHRATNEITEETVFQSASYMAEKANSDESNGTDDNL